MADPISVQIDTKRLDQIFSTLDVNADYILGAAALEVEGNAKSSFGTGPAGREYVHGNVVHVASAPPGPPAVDTGALRASVTSERIGDLQWSVHDGVEYGAYQEFGTPHIAPRPWLYPAVFKMIQTFNKRWEGLFK